MRDQRDAPMKIPWPWWCWWLRWQSLWALANTCHRIGRWAFLQSVTCATACYVTGGPVTCRDYLDEVVPPKEETAP
jgi:hypothetical protein